MSEEEEKMLLEQWNEAVNKGQEYAFMVKAAEEPEFIKAHAKLVAWGFVKQFGKKSFAYVKNPRHVGSDWCKFPTASKEQPEQRYVISVKRQSADNRTTLSLEFSSGHKVEFSTFEEWQTYIKGDAFIQDFCDYYTNLANAQTTVQNGTGNE